MPDEYYTHQFSGEEIDEILTAARQSLKNAANDSLIVNGDFRAGCLVDQRQGRVVFPGVAYRATPNSTAAVAGTTDKYYEVSYYSASWWTISINDTTYYVYNGDVQTTRGYVGTGYHIDMWRVTSAAADAVIRIEDDGILIQSGSARLFMAQYLETKYVLDGGGMLSALVGAVTGAAYVQVGYTDGTYTAATALATGLYAKAVDGEKKVDRVYFQVNAGATIKLKAAKLELGDQQTLAHQDSSGNWVLNEIPSYAETLRECQRYLVDVAGRYDIIQTFGTTVWFAINLPCDMRAAPSFAVRDATNVNLFRGGNLVSGATFDWNAAAYTIGRTGNVTATYPTGYSPQLGDCLSIGERAVFATAEL